MSVVSAQTLGDTQQVFDAQVFGGDIGSQEIDWANSQYDETLNLLRKMFGSVGDTLSGGVDGLTALQFKIFNISIMVFASIFVGATITQSVIASASQGVFMGKKQGQSSYFTLFRSTVGLMSVFPQYNGYSLIQVFVMSIVLKSASLASQISTLILEKVMLDSPIEMFKQAQGEGDKANAVKRNALDNPEVKAFYEAVFSSAVKSVIHNRQQPEFSQESFAQSLYRIKPNGDNYVVEFKGVDEKIELYGYGNTSIVLNDNLKMLISPIVTKVFNCWPKGLPSDAEPRNCEAVEQLGPCGQDKIQIAQAIVKSINENHDKLSENFTEAIVLNASETTELKRGYLSNWIHFPFMYQAALDVKAAGLEKVTLFDLVEKAFPKDASTGVLEKPNIPASTIYTSLGGKRNPEGRVYPIVKSAIPDGERLQRGISELKSIFPAKVPARVFSDSDKDQALRLVRGYLYQFDLSVRSSPDITQTAATRDSTKGHADQAKEFFNNTSEKELKDLWNNFDPRGDYSSPAFSSLSAERVAMEAPVSSFIRYTGENWIKTFIGSEAEAPAIIISPITALVDLTTKMSRDTLLFVFTLIRNVAAEQIVNAAQTFWEFFGIKIATTAGSAVSEISTGVFHDRLSCLMMNFFMGMGSSPRSPVCSPVMLMPFPPIPNPLYFVDLGLTLAGTVITTIGHTVAQVVDDVTSSIFSYIYLYKSQFEYAYYTYILVAATPVMIVSNILAVWIPMLPSLVYFVAIVGWLFSVVEAMIASPLVLLGMTFPQGHDFLGSSQQALILLLSVFVRAPLIVIGFFMSMLFFYIAMIALGQAVIPLVLSIFNYSGDPSLGEAFIMFAFMLVIMYITGTLLSQALSFTYKLPNAIVAWVGGQQMEGTEAAAVQQLQSVVNQQQQGALNSIQQAGIAGSRDQMSGQAAGGFKAGKLGKN